MKSRAINAILRQKTGKTISEFAKSVGVSRETLYRTIRGEGSREIRTKIALIIGILPSIIWEDNDEETKLLDNIAYIQSCKPIHKPKSESSRRYGL